VRGSGIGEDHPAGDAQLAAAHAKGADRREIVALRPEHHAGL
jgi:hypothetical protein